MPLIHGLAPGAQVAWCGARELDAVSYSLDVVTCARCQVARRGVEREAPEQAWLAAVVQEARRHGYLSYHTRDSRGSAPGFPDICIVDPTPAGQRPGGDVPIFLCELKTARGKLTREQELWLRALDGKQVVAQVWRPADMATIRAQFGREKGDWAHDATRRDRTRLDATRQDSTRLD